MKKTFFALLLAALTCTIVMAGDVIKVLSVYHNGVRTTIPLAGIDSLDHSMYDADSILHSEYTSSIVHAIDRDYQIPIASIDSIVVDEINVQEYDSQINEISDFINQQTELEINAFQDNLLTWLNANENIQEATINETKDFISVKFKNGLDFYIDFQDMSFFKDEEEEFVRRNGSQRKANDDDDGYYNVSEQQGEIIINSPNILYVKGMFLVPSLLDDERIYLQELIESVPVKCQIEDCNESLGFALENYANYGLVIFSKTHGGGRGSFMVTRNPSPDANDPLYYINSKALIIYKDDISEETRVTYTEPVYLVQPTLNKKKIRGNNKTVIYGNYCRSAESNINWVFTGMT